MKKAKKKLLKRVNVMLGDIDKKRALKVAKKMEGSTNVSKGIREALRLVNSLFHTNA